MAELARIVGAALVAGLVLGCSGSAAEHLEATDQPRHQVVKCLGVIDAIPEPVPGCVEVLASSGDEEISVWLAAGASCDGRA